MALAVTSMSWVPLAPRMRSSVLVANPNCVSSPDTSSWYTRHAGLWVNSDYPLPPPSSRERWDFLTRSTLLAVGGCQEMMTGARGGSSSVSRTLAQLRSWGLTVIRPRPTSILCTGMGSLTQDRSIWTGAHGGGGCSMKCWPLGYVVGSGRGLSHPNGSPSP